MQVVGQFGTSLIVQNTANFNILLCIILKLTECTNYIFWETGESLIQLVACLEKKVGVICKIMNVDS